ncbi:hypothetical protein VIGAN_11064400, partial [Vigna angularis var. angularis]
LYRLNYSFLFPSFSSFYTNSFYFPSPPLFSGDSRRNLNREPARKIVLPIFQNHPLTILVPSITKLTALLYTVFFFCFVLLLIHPCNAFGTCEY